MLRYLMPQWLRSHEVEIGEISDFVGEQIENFKNVNINPQLSNEEIQEVISLLSEFTDLFTDVPKVTNLETIRFS